MKKFTLLLMALMLVAGPVFQAVAIVDETKGSGGRWPNVSICPSDVPVTYTYLLEAYNASDTLIMSLTPAGAFALTATFTLTGAFTMSGDLTVSGADIQLGATGVKLSSDNDGAITFLGCSAGADEDLTINLDDTANEITLSTSTSATMFDLDGALDLEISGNDLQLGEAGVKFTSDGDGAVTILGCSAGSDEDLTINLDDTADEATFSSSTGVTCVDLDGNLDLEISGNDLQLGESGVKMTSDGDGAITFLGCSAGSDENLTINLDDTANEATITSSTDADVNFSEQTVVTTLGSNDRLYVKGTTTRLDSTECLDVDATIDTTTATTDVPVVTVVATRPVGDTGGTHGMQVAVTTGNQANGEVSSAFKGSFDSQLSDTATGIAAAFYAATPTVTTNTCSDYGLYVVSGYDKAAYLTGDVDITGNCTVGTYVVPDVSGGAVLGSEDAEWAALYLADSGKIYLGDDQEITLTHVHNDGILLGTTCELQFYDSTEKIASTGNGLLTLSAATSIAVAAGDVDDYWNFKASGNNPIMEVVGAGNGYIEFAGGVLYLGDGSNTMASFTDAGSTVTAVINGSLGVNTTLTVTGDAAINGGDITTTSTALAITGNTNKTFKYAHMPLSLGSSAVQVITGGIAQPAVCVGLAGVVESGAAEGYVDLGDAADFLTFFIDIPETYADTTGVTGELVLMFDIHEQAAEEVNLEVRVFEKDSTAANTTAIFTDTITIANGAARALVYMDTLGIQGIDEDTDIDADDVLLVEITQEGADNAEDCYIYGARLKYRTGFTVTQ